MQTRRITKKDGGISIVPVGPRDDYSWVKWSMYSPFSEKQEQGKLIREVKVKEKKQKAK